MSPNLVGGRPSLSLEKLLAEALRPVTRAVLFPGDRGHEKWLTKTAATILATPAGRKLDVLVSAGARAVGEHGPGDPWHHYRIECEVCGKPGTLNLSLEPQRALGESGSAVEPGSEP